MATIVLTPADTPVYAVDIRTILRACTVGVLISTLFFGVLIHQLITFVLRKNESKDRIDASLVGATAICSTALFITQTIFMFGLLVTHYGAPDPLPSFFAAPWLILAVFNPLINAFAQSFFARRAWKLYDRDIAVALFLGVCILGSFVAGIGQIVQAETADFGSRTSFSEFSKTMAKVTQAHYLSAAGLDVAISSLISYKLARAKKGFSARTNHILTRLLTLSLTTASLTALVATVAAAFALVHTQIGIGYVVLSMWLPRIYAISMMFAINTRDYNATSKPIAFGSISHHRGGLSGGPGSPRFAPAASTGGYNHSQRTYTTSQGIHVQLDVVQHEDSEGSHKDVKV